MQRPSPSPVTTPFGFVPGYPLNGGYHMGVDFAYIPDNKIYAPEDGNYRLYPNNGSLGNAVHMWADNRHHAFGHTSEYLIADNQFVSRGTPIAVMGQTGAADGVHLHWALAINGNLVDPLTQVNETFKGGNDVATIENADNWYWRCNKTHQLIRGRDLGRDVFATFVGQDFLHFVEACEDDPEADAVQNWQNVGKTAVTDKWDQQIYSLQAQLAAATSADDVDKKKLADALVQVNALAEQIKNSPAASSVELDTNSKVTSIFNYFSNQFKTFSKYIKKG